MWDFRCVIYFLIGLGVVIGFAIVGLIEFAAWLWGHLSCVS